VGDDVPRKEVRVPLGDDLEVFRLYRESAAVEELKTCSL
jgi:hypothetical protein